MSEPCKMQNAGRRQWRQPCHPKTFRGCPFAPPVFHLTQSSPVKAGTPLQFPILNALPERRKSTFVTGPVSGCDGFCDGLAFRKCLMDNLCDGVTAQNPWTAAIRRISVLNSPLAMLPATQGCQPRLRNRREYRSMLIINVLRRSTFQPQSTPVKAGQGWSRGSFSSFILHESGQSKSR